MNKKLGLAVAGAVLALSSAAQAGITIPAGDWTLDIGGNVNAYYTSTRLTGDKTAGYATFWAGEGQGDALAVPHLVHVVRRATDGALGDGLVDFQLDQRRAGGFGHQRGGQLHAQAAALQAEQLADAPLQRDLLARGQHPGCGAAGVAALAPDLVQRLRAAVIDAFRALGHARLPPLGDGARRQAGRVDAGPPGRNERAPAQRSPPVDSML